MRVVKYWRSNLVKWAVASIRDNHVVSSVCHQRSGRRLLGDVNNVVHGSRCETLAAKVGGLPIAPTRLLNNIFHSLSLLQRLDAFTARVAAQTNQTVIEARCRSRCDGCLPAPCFRPPV